MHIKEMRELLKLPPYCNHRPERAPRIFGHTFPLCWRCTGVLIGALTVYWFMRQLPLRMWDWIAIAVVLMIPMVVDGTLQLLTSYTSTNTKRALTGILAGVGAAAIDAMLYQNGYTLTWVWDQLTKLI